jgi:hypothetical protein
MVEFYQITIQAESAFLVPFCMPDLRSELIAISSSSAPVRQLSDDRICHRQANDDCRHARRRAVYDRRADAQG